MGARVQCVSGKSDPIPVMEHTDDNDSAYKLDHGIKRISTLQVLLQVEEPGDDADPITLGDAIYGANAAITRNDQEVPLMGRLIVGRVCFNRGWNQLV